MEQPTIPPVIPPDSVLGDDARRKRLEREYVKAAEITATLAVVTKLIPGPAGKLVGALAAGLEKNPETGKVRPGIGMSGNLAPSPIGFVDPEAYGLKKNFYLPAGASSVIPRAADRLGLGLAQQRAEDEARVAARSQARAAVAVQGESSETLEDIVAGRGGPTRAGVIIATSEAGFGDLQRAAQVEIARRAAQAVPGGTVADALFPAEAEAARAKQREAEQAAIAERLVAGTELGLAVFTGLGSLDAIQAVLPPDP